MELIIGANGYVGRHLAWSRRGRDCTLHSASPPEGFCAHGGMPFVQEDLVTSRARLAELNPETVFLLGRPVTMDPNVLLDFAQNTQWLLQEWADRGCLRRVIFTSTQLVYATPADATPIPVQSPLGPQTPYDCHKAEMEFFLALLAHHNSIRNIDIHRLPLVAGRPPTGARKNPQFLFHWRECYQHGVRWVFDIGDPMQDSWGNSWVHMDDLVRVMGEEPPEGVEKYRTRQPVSGHFTYRQLDEFFMRNDSPPPIRERLHLSRHCFFLRDNTGIEPRGIEEAYAEVSTVEAVTA
ncbi:MAG TPA: SDR family oxidoreductase [Chthoniobacteraceae bacterium]|nr:SDR family oxidoreductase [Chthoniobacteraceae bacterium]